MNGKAEAWAEYWRETAATGGGCAPNSPGITAATARIWRDFAGSLPRRASVLDLATGNGAVLQHVRAVQPAAMLVGVDSAPDLGRRTDGSMTLTPGVAMERLPFEDRSFDAVTSQFGYEYGLTEVIAGEVFRVIRPGGKVRLLIHHLESPVVRQGRARREELQWALGPESPLAQAMNVASARLLGPLPIPPGLRAAPGQAASLFPGHSVAAEIMTGMLQMLELGGTNAPTLLRQLQAKVGAEVGRLDALIVAARGEAAIMRIGDELTQAGLTVTATKQEREAPGATSFAWLIDASLG